MFKHLRKGLLIAPILLLLLLGFATAFAHTATTNCSANCESHQVWSGGSTYGFGSQTTVSSPGLHDTNAQWERRFVLSTSGGNPQVEVGITKGRGTLGACGVGLWYYSRAVGSDGSYHGGTCFPVPSADINAGSFFQINDYTSNGGGNLVQVFSAGGVSRLTQFFPYTDHLSSTYNTINYDEDITDHVTGHEVWGSLWTNNQWVQSNGTFVYITVNGTLSTHSPTPPQMYWFKTPNSSPSGGQLYSCEYDSTSNSCTLGS